MKLALLIGVMAVVLTAVSSEALACQFNTDCAVGAKCLKRSGNIYGYCVGGLKPANSNDQKPAYDPLDITGKKGSTCSFNTDCGVGGNCVKSSGSITGTCL